MNPGTSKISVNPSDKRYLSASLVFTSGGKLEKNKIVITDRTGFILDALNTTDVSVEDSDIEFHEGILCPGFINTHCHLELSHMKDAIQEQQGMTGFIADILEKRNTFSKEQIMQGIEQSEQEMLQNGIVAVGDISNTTDTITQKNKQNIFYHTFVELFDIIPSHTEKTILNGNALLTEYFTRGLNASLTPHAPYTVTPELLKYINASGKNVLSIHNQESQEENELFISKTGKMAELFSKIGSSMKAFEPTGKGALSSILPYLSGNRTVLLVHNTYSTEEDIKEAQAYLNNNLFWCTCPNANLYIENRLPDYNLFLRNNSKVTIGTDSLASNHTLSILDELKTIAAQFPKIKTETLLTWATSNGAKALNINDRFGSFEKGKKPGIVLLTNVEAGINKHSRVTAL